MGMHLGFVHRSTLDLNCATEETEHAMSIYRHKTCNAMTQGLILDRKVQLVLTSGFQVRIN